MRLIRVAGDRCPVCPARSPRPPQTGCWNSRPEWDVRPASSSSSAWVQDRRLDGEREFRLQAGRQMRRLEGSGVSGHAPHLGSRAELPELWDKCTINTGFALSEPIALTLLLVALRPAAIKPKRPRQGRYPLSRHDIRARHAPRSRYFDHHPARRLVLRALTNCQDECA